ncbi:MAG TPA: cytochrome c [Bryobacteraceae bacterium]|nr:cytochrome c [Bryobacteraceae bacterium]
MWKLFACTLLAAGIASAQPAGNADNGKKLFSSKGCWECHGYAGQGGRDGARIAATSLTEQAFIRYVRKPSGAMPAFVEKILPDPELADIYAYVKSLPAPKQAKDVPLLNQIKNAK